MSSREGTVMDETLLHALSPHSMTGSSVKFARPALRCAHLPNGIPEIPALEFNSSEMSNDLVMLAPVIDNIVAYVPLQIQILCHSLFRRGRHYFESMSILERRQLYTTSYEVLSGQVLLLDAKRDLLRKRILELQDSCSHRELTIHEEQRWDGTDCTRECKECGYYFHCFVERRI